jgi:hypothetical protein
MNIAEYILIFPGRKMSMGENAYVTPVPSQGHYGFHSFPVVDLFCLFGMRKRAGRKEYKEKDREDGGRMVKR